MKRRLLQYDVSRGLIPKTEAIARHIDFLKPRGLTGVLLYVECVVENDVFPVAGCGDTPITQDYLTELGRVCDAEGIELVPLFEILGHQEHLLALPEMANLREGEDLTGNFRLDDRETRERIQAWLGELIPAFKSDFVHVGGDEAFQVGLGRSAALIEDVGFERAVADYFNEFSSFLRSLGKSMVMCADPLIHYLGIRDLLDPEIIICNWGYGGWDEIYERENHNFKAHDFVTANRRNWVFGNNMAEYMVTPFQRLETNVDIWLDLGGKSGADTFVISDWGSYENTNPFVNSLIGSLFILRHLNDPSYSLEDLTEEMSQWVLGQRDERFEAALTTLLTAQRNPKYFPERLLTWSPCFPTLMLGDPNSKEVIRICASLDEDSVKTMETDARDVVEKLNAFNTQTAARPDMLDDVKALARRFLMIALRTRLCRDHAWSTGAVWLEKDHFDEKRQRLMEYQRLAREDLNWRMTQWRRDALESCRERCRLHMERAIESVSETVTVVDNCMLRYPPRRRINSRCESCP